MQPQVITLTGADEKTDLRALQLMVAQRPYVEIGLLYTATPEGRNRYPTLDLLLDAADALSGRCAVHVCGTQARKDLLDGTLVDLLTHAPRIQVNGIVTVREAEQMARAVPTLITQHHENNSQLLELSAGNHCILVDGSGGRGLSPAAWIRPDTKKSVGFAGGMGPTNVSEELVKISKIAGAGAWVDMENKVRVDDLFSLTLASQAADAFAKHVFSADSEAKVDG